MLSLKAAAAEYGLSYWTLRDRVNDGTIPRVRLPGTGGRDMRRILLDRRDLDRLIEQWKA